MAGAEAGTVHPDGLPWDVDQSPPDLFVELGTEAEFCVTGIDWDDYSPDWNAACILWVSYDPLITLDLWEHDSAVDEYVAGWIWDGPTAVRDLATSDGVLASVLDRTGTVRVDLWMTPD